MSFEVTIRDGIIFAQGSGTITALDLDQLADEVAKLEEELPKSPHRLTDASEITRLDLDYRKMEAVASRRRKAPLKNKVKSAFVTPRLDQFGFARMFATLNDNPKIEIQIFDDRDKALKWLGT